MPQVTHNIALRGICTAGEGENAVDQSKFSPRDKSIRNIVHEVGRFLGLTDENVGLSALVHRHGGRVGIFKATLEQQKYVSSKFDPVSVMDCLQR